MERVLLSRFIIVFFFFSAILGNGLYKLGGNIIVLKDGDGISFYDKEGRFISKNQEVKWVLNQVKDNNNLWGLAFNGVSYYGIIKISDDNKIQIYNLSKYGIVANYFEKIIVLSDKIHVLVQGNLYTFDFNVSTLISKTDLSLYKPIDFYIKNERIYLLSNNKLIILSVETKRELNSVILTNKNNGEFIGGIDKKIFMKYDNSIFSYEVNEEKVDLEYEQINVKEEIQVYKKSLFSKEGFFLTIFNNSMVANIPFGKYQFFDLTDNKIYSFSNQKVSKTEFETGSNEDFEIVDEPFSTFLQKQNNKKIFFNLSFDNTQNRKLIQNDSIKIDEKKSNLTTFLILLNSNYSISKYNIENKIPLFANSSSIFLVIIATLFLLVPAFFIKRFCCLQYFIFLMTISVLMIYLSVITHLVAIKVFYINYLFIVIGSIIGLIYKTYTKTSQKKLAYGIFQLTHGGEGYKNLFQINRTIKNFSLFTKNDFEQKISSSKNIYNSITYKQINEFLYHLPFSRKHIFQACQLSVSSTILFYLNKINLMSNTLFLRLFDSILSSIQMALSSLKLLIAEASSNDLNLLLSELKNICSECKIDILTIGNIKEYKIIIDKKDFFSIFSLLIANSRDLIKDEILDIRIKIFYENNRIKIFYGDNCPIIPDKIKRTIFLPSTSTKTDGGFGMYEIQKTLTENLAQIELIDKISEYKFKLTFRVVK